MSIFHQFLGACSLTYFVLLLDLASFLVLYINDFRITTAMNGVSADGSGILVMTAAPAAGFPAAAGSG